MPIATPLFSEVLLTTSVGAGQTRTPARRRSAHGAASNPMRRVTEHDQLSHAPATQYSSGSLGPLDSCRSASQFSHDVVHIAVHDDLAVLKQNTALTDRRHQVQVVADHE